MDNQGKKPSATIKIRNSIVAGIFIVIPVGITCWLGWIVFDMFTEWSKPIIRQVEYFTEFENVFWFNLLARLASLIVMLTALFIVGEIAKFAVGRRLMRGLEGIILGIPMVSAVYSTIRQIVDAVKGTSKGGMFSQVALIEFPRKGIYCLAFVTNENGNGSEITARTGKNLVSVFMPTTPNPTSGFLMFVPREDCIFLGMDINDGMKLIISGGVIMPPTAGEAKEISNSNRET